MTTDVRRRVVPRLYVMMFLQYAVYGLWLPIAARFLSADPAAGGLGFNDFQIGMIVAVAGAIGALSAPLLVGQIADRHFAPARCLAVLLAVGGVIKYVTAYQTSYAAWLWLSIAYAILFMPTGCPVGARPRTEGLPIHYSGTLPPESAWSPPYWWPGFSATRRNSILWRDNDQEIPYRRGGPDARSCVGQLG